MYKNKIVINDLERNNIAGITIAALRIERGWSQNDLAIHLQNINLDLHKNAISDIENGKRFITDIELKKFSELFNKSIDELITLNNSNFTPLLSHEKQTVISNQDFSVS